MKWLVAFLLVFFMGGGLLPSPTYAISDPDSISVESIRIFNNLWSSGDQLYVVEYKVMYASDPPENPEDTLLTGIWSGSIPQYSRPLGYYDHNVSSIYLTASEALTWEGSYLVKVMGNPVYYTPLVEGTNVATVGLSAGNWVSGVQAMSRSYLETWVSTLAGTLETSWGIDLLTDEGRLNTVGSSVFKAAIPGLDTVIPDMFQVSAETTGFEERTFTQLYEESLLERVGDRLQTALDNLGTFLHLPGELVGILGLMVLYFILAGRIMVATGSAPASIAVSFPFLIAGSFMGLLPLSWLFMAVFVVLVLFGVTFILVKV